MTTPPSFFHHQNITLFPKFLDGSFNNNTTNFGKKSMLAVPTQPTSPTPKFLDNCFNGNSTNFNPRPKNNVSLMMPM